MKLLLGLALGFAIGGLCFLFTVPAPAPPVIEGALLVVAMTVGYGLMDRQLSSQGSDRERLGRPTDHHLGETTEGGS
ncbi:MAG: DUF1427 family protein [Pseudomonadota bacterium]